MCEYSTFPIRKDYSNWSFSLEWKVKGDVTDIIKSCMLELEVLKLMEDRPKRISLNLG